MINKFILNLMAGVAIATYEKNGRNTFKKEKQRSMDGFFLTSDCRRLITKMKKKNL